MAALLLVAGFCSNNFPGFLAEDLLRKPLAYLCPQIICQYSSCFQFIEPQTTPLSFSADVLRQAQVL
jgi:hypothetical protein